eukprot:3131302-Prymnesium_polylepis.2
MALDRALANWDGCVVCIASLSRAARDVSRRRSCAYAAAQSDSVPTPRLQGAACGAVCQWCQCEHLSAQVTRLFVAGSLLLVGDLHTRAADGAHWVAAANRLGLAVSSARIGLGRHRLLPRGAAPLRSVQEPHRFCPGHRWSAGPHLHVSHICSNANSTRTR